MSSEIPAPTREPRVRTLAFVGLVLACAIVPFLSGLHGALLWDDTVNIRDNALLRTLAPTADLWAPPLGGLVGRPFVAGSFALNYAVSGLDTWSYHAVNIALHALAALALFACVRAALALGAAHGRAALGGTGLAAAIAGLWAVHPLHTSAVTYVSQRCEGLAGLMVLVATWCALQSFLAERPRAWQLGAVAAGVLAGFTKESAVALPIVILLLDAALASGSLRAALTRRRGFYAVLLLVWIAVLVVVSSGASFRSVGELRSAGLDTWGNLKLQAWAITHYLGLAFWPDPLVLDYGWPLRTSAAEWLPHGILVLALVAASAVAFVRAPRLGALGLAFFVLLAPTSSFVVIPMEPVAEWRMYLPLACLVALAACAFARSTGSLAAGKRTLAGALASLAAALPLAWHTHTRNAEYADAVGFWEREARVHGTNHRTWYSLAETLRDEKRMREALAAYDRASELLPEYAPYYNNRAFAALDLGDVDTAMRHYQRSIELEPSLIALQNLAKLCLLTGQPARAEELFRRALSFDANDATTRGGLGRALVALKRPREGLAELRIAIGLAPRSPRVLESLILLLATTSDDTLRDAPGALALAEGALRDRAGDAPVLERLLAAALAANGRHAEAAEHATRALAEARARNASRLAAALQLELGLYQSGATPRDLEP